MCGVSLALTVPPISTSIYLSIHLNVVLLFVRLPVRLFTHHCCREERMLIGPMIVIAAWHPSQKEISYIVCSLGVAVRTKSNTNYIGIFMNTIARQSVIFRTCPINGSSRNVMTRYSCLFIMSSEKWLIQLKCSAFQAYALHGECARCRIGT